MHIHTYIGVADINEVTYQTHTHTLHARHTHIQTHLKLSSKQEGSSAEISDSDISRNRQTGVTAALANTTLSISGCKITRNSSHGFALLKGAQVVVTATTLSGNGAVGFFARCV